MDAKKVNILALSIYRDLAEDFALSLMSDLNEAVELGDHQVKFSIFAGDPAQDPSFDECMRQANAVALIVRFLDVLSMDKIKSIYRHLPDEINVPFAVFLLRDRGEVDFKISCPSCGQKLWLRDTDVGKRGRCPNCKKPFVISSQQDHLKTQLMLPDSVEVVQTTRGDHESVKTAVLGLLGSLSFGIKPAVTDFNAEALKNATMPIQIQDA